jgi:type VI secretion system protein ImpJ
MNDAGKPNAPIQWHEGMLLSPHHFQQMGIQSDAMRHYLIRGLFPYYWGVVKREVDETALADGVFRITSLEAVLPDGTFVDFGNRHPEPLQIDLSEHLEALKSKPQKIWLAVPTLKADAPWTGGELPRFRSVEGDAVYDMNTGSDEIFVPRLRPILSLHFEKPSKLYSVLPIAEVVNRDNGLGLTEFCPPCVSADPQSAIYRLCRELNGSLRRKVSQLAGNLESQRGGDPATVQAIEYTLHHLVAGLPAFEGVFGSNPAPHPYHLYLSLCDLSGKLAALNESRVPPVPPTYDHDDPLASIHTLCTVMIRTLERRVSETWDGISFQQKEGFFFIHFKKDWLNHEWVLAVAPGRMSNRDCKRWLGGSLIASEVDVRDLRKRRITGMQRGHVDAVPALVAPEGALLFTLEPTADAPVRPGKRLLVIPVTHDAEYLPEAITLFVKKR